MVGGFDENWEEISMFPFLHKGVKWLTTSFTVLFQFVLSVFFFVETVPQCTSNEK